MCRDLDPARQEPCWANEILRTLALESVELDLLVILNDATAEGRLFVRPTYTALLELHDELASHGHVLQFWQDEKDGRR